MQLIKSLNYILSKKLKTEAIIILTTIVITTLLEIIGIGLIIPFFIIIFEGNSFSENSFIVSDSLERTFKYAKSRFYFHPDLLVSLEDKLLRIEGTEFILHSDLTGKVASLVDSSWYPEFGVEMSNKMLELQFEQPQLDIVFTWSKH